MLYVTSLYGLGVAITLHLSHYDWGKGSMMVPRDLPTQLSTFELQLHTPSVPSTDVGRLTFSKIALTDVVSLLARHGQ